MHVFILSIFGQLILNGLLIWVVYLATRKHSPWRKIVLGLSLTELLLFLIFYALRDSFSFGLQSRLLALFNGYYIAQVIFMLYLFIPYLVTYILEWTRVLTKPKAKRSRAYLFTIVAVGTIGLCIWGHQNTIRPRVTTYDLQLAYEGEPKERKIVLVTDTHIGELIGTKEIARLREMVRAEKPDYLLIGGDILDYSFEYIHQAPELTELMQSLHPEPNRVFYVMGNHEYYADTEEKRAWLSTLGTLLLDDVVQLEDSLYLVTRDDATQENRLPLQQLMEQVPEGATTILLEHQPATTEDSMKEGIDLALHGHTHRGQFIPFSYAVALRFPINYGWYQKGDTQYVVSSGFGVAGATYRIGTHSEIVVLNLKLGAGATS